MIVENKQIDTSLLNRKNTDLRTTKSIRIGAGNTIMGADVRGLWLGAKIPEDAPFYVDMEGNLRGLNLVGVTITGSTITGGIFRTAEDGQRIEINSDEQNKITFYDEADVYGKLEVYSDGSTGYVSLQAEDGEAEMRIETGFGLNAGYRGIGLSAYEAFISASGNPVIGQGISMGFPDALGLTLNINDYFGYQKLAIYNLPTSAPIDAGCVWNDGGTLKIT